MNNFKTAIAAAVTALAAKNFADMAEVDAAVKTSLETELQPLLQRIDDLEQAVLDVAKAAADDDMPAVLAAVSVVTPAAEPAVTENETSQPVDGATA